MHGTVETKGGWSPVRRKNGLDNMYAIPFVFFSLFRFSLSMGHGRCVCNQYWKRYESCCIPKPLRCLSYFARHAMGAMVRGKNDRNTIMYRSNSGNDIGSNENHHQNHHHHHHHVHIPHHIRIDSCHSRKKKEK